MCGRFVRYVSLPEAAEEFSAGPPEEDLEASYNIAPGRDIALVINDGRRRIIRCRWGFIPSWAKDPSIGYKLINARAETVSQKASYKTAFRRHRCLIVANGFYEWHREGNTKTPVYVHLKSRGTFGLAGLYNVWTSPEGGHICTVTIITTAANELLKPVHDRMPDIISRDGESVWLDPSVQDYDSLAQFLTPYPSEDMNLHEVSGIVNSASNDSPECIKPVRADR